MPDIISRHESCSVACPLMHLFLSLSLSVCVPLSPLAANFQRCRWGHSEGRTLQGGERLIRRGCTRAHTQVYFLQLRILTSKSAFVFFRGWGKQTSDYTPGTWRRTDVHLENPEYHTRWFFKYFLGKGQCIHVRPRRLNAARGSPGDEYTQDILPAWPFFSS